MSLRQSIASLLPHNTRMVVAPPGALPSGTPGTILLLPSVMRSGTHVLIDSILNNFQEFKRSPLYIDLDQFIEKRRDVLQILNAGSYLVKTHYPQVDAPGLEEAVAKLGAVAKIISPVREHKAVLRSTLAFFPGQSEIDIRRAHDRFTAYWSRHERLQVNFENLLREQTFDREIQRIARYLGMQPRARLIRPPGKQRKGRVYVFKAMTRIAGKYSPIVNTTISIGTTPRERN